MESHAKKCVERYCELANKTTQQLYKVTTPCTDYHQFANSTLHTSHFLVGSHLMTRTCVAQAQVWRAQRTFHIISCVIFMRSCCVFDSPRLSLLLLAVRFLPYRLFHLPGLQLLLPRCGGQVPCAFPLMRTLALLPSTTLSQVMSPTTTTSRRPLNRTSRNPPARTGS